MSQLTVDGFGPIHESLTANLYFMQGRVVATSPPGGDLARPGTAVTVYVSLGAESCLSRCVSGTTTVRMPDVCGLTFQEAATKLAAKDITLLPPHRNPDPPGRVTGSVPAFNQLFIAYGSASARPVTVTLTTASSGAASPGPSC